MKLFILEMLYAILEYLSRLLEVLFPVSIAYSIYLIIKVIKKINNKGE